MNCSFIGIGLEVFTVLTYLYLLLVWIVVMKRIRHKLELKKYNVGVKEVKGLEGRVYSYFEKTVEKRAEAIVHTQAADIKP